MNRVEELEHAIEALSADEFDALATRVLEIQQKRWDRQLDQDATAGRLDFLIEEARSEKATELLKDGP